MVFCFKKEFSYSHGLCWDCVYWRPGYDSWCFSLGEIFYTLIHLSQTALDCGLGLTHFPRTARLQKTISNKWKITQGAAGPVQPLQSSSRWEQDRLRGGARGGGGAAVSVPQTRLLETYSDNLSLLCSFLKIVWLAVHAKFGLPNSTNLNI